MDYKNIKLLKKYVSENGKILPSKITNISQKKQRAFSFNQKSKKLSINIKWNDLIENVKRIGSIGEVIDAQEVSLELSNC